MKKWRQLKPRERLLIRLLVAVVLVIAFVEVGNFYTRVYLPWARLREADALLAEYRDAPSQETAQRLAEIADEDLIPGRKWVEILETILKPTVEKPKPFRTDERVAIRLARPKLEFHRHFVKEAGRCFVSLDGREHGWASWRGARVNPLQLGLVPNVSGGGSPVPGHYSARVELRHDFYRHHVVPFTDRVLYKLGLKGPTSHSMNPSTISLEVGFEFDVVEACKDAGAE